MDVLAPTTMKDAAKCDEQCELQNSVNHQTVERKWHSGVYPRVCLLQCLQFLSCHYFTIYSKELLR